MKPVTFIIQVVAIIALSWLLGYFLPWWIFSVVCFISGLLASRMGFFSFVAGFTGMSLYYFTASAIQARGDNFVFANKIGEILGSSMNTSIGGFALLCIGTLLFGLLGGLFAWSGSLILSTEPSNRLLSGRGRNRSKSLKLDLKRYQQ